MEGRWSFGALDSNLKALLNDCNIIEENHCKRLLSCQYSAWFIDQRAACDGSQIHISNADILRKQVLKWHYFFVRGLNTVKRTLRLRKYGLGLRSISKVCLHFSLLDNGVNSSMEMLEVGSWHSCLWWEWDCKFQTLLGRPRSRHVHNNLCACAMSVRCC